MPGIVDIIKVFLKYGVYYDYVSSFTKYFFDQEVIMYAKIISLLVFLLLVAFFFLRVVFLTDVWEIIKKYSVYINNKNSGLLFSLGSEEMFVVQVVIYLSIAFFSTSGFWIWFLTALILEAKHFLKQ